MSSKGIDLPDSNRNQVTVGKDRQIFVFGSNRKGIHGAGAAKTAVFKYGAKPGQGEGLQGNSYAIPTKSTPWITLPLEEIRPGVDSFKEFARANPEMQFQVTRIGCGLAGYQDADIAPMFNDASDNCILPEGWRDSVHGGLGERLKPLVSKTSSSQK